ncbi:MAG TPA: hypothetical protein VGD81_15940 [Opitutaceae bacterium]
MTLTDALTDHLTLCDDIYQHALEENRFIQRERCPPDEPLRERKLLLSARLDVSLAALREATRMPGARGGELLERARARSLQILHLDRENEQLLLRCSLAPTRPAVAKPSIRAAQVYASSH